MSMTPEERTYPCCECCEGLALDDHEGHGGDIEKDGHDGPCSTCQTGNARLLLAESERADRAEVELARLWAAIQEARAVTELQIASRAEEVIAAIDESLGGADG